MLKRKENFKCYGIKTRPAKNRRVLYAPVKVNPPTSPPPGHVGPYLHVSSSLRPQYVGDSRVLSLLCRGVWGIRRGFIQIQDGDHRSCKGFWVNLATCDHSRWRTQVSRGICGIRFIVIQISTCPNRAGI